MLWKINFCLLLNYVIVIVDVTEKLWLFFFDFDCA